MKIINLIHINASILIIQLHFYQYNPLLQMEPYWDQNTDFTINPVKISSATLKYSSTTWTGNARTQTNTIVVKAKVNGSTKTLTKGTDYTVGYSNNKNVGKATVTIKGTGNYNGTITKTFNINPKGTSISNLTKASKAITVKWNKQASPMSASRITGYQIQLATNNSRRIRKLSL